MFAPRVWSEGSAQMPPCFQRLTERRVYGRTASSIDARTLFRGEDTHLYRERSFTHAAVAQDGDFVGRHAR